MSLTGEIARDHLTHKWNRVEVFDVRILTPFIDDRAQRSVVSVMEPEPAGVSPGIPGHGVGLQVSLLSVFTVNLVSQTGHGVSGLRFRFPPGVRDSEPWGSSLTQPRQVFFEPERIVDLDHPGTPLTQHGRSMTTSAHQTVSTVGGQASSLDST